MEIKPMRASLILISSLILSCSSNDSTAPTRPYEDDKTVLITPDGVTTSQTPNGDGCIETEKEACIKPQEKCGDEGHADVILDGDGRVVEIVCYPLEEDTVFVEAEDGSVTVEDNGAVILLEEETLEGDLTVEGNSATLYGQSPEETVIEGQVAMEGNQAIVRGVWIKGDAVFEGNGATLIYCVVEGDVILKGNGNVVSNCTIFGAIVVDTNANRIISNFVQGGIDLGGSSNECEDNHKFNDADGDLQLSEDERGELEPIKCGGKDR